MDGGCTGDCNDGEKRLSWLLDAEMQELDGGGREGQSVVRLELLALFIPALCPLARCAPAASAVKGKERKCQLRRTAVTKIIIHLKTVHTLIASVKPSLRSPFSILIPFMSYGSDNSFIT